jgi:hypothetical protein
LLEVFSCGCDSWITKSNVVLPENVPRPLGSLYVGYVPVLH